MIDSIIQTGILSIAIFLVAMLLPGIRLKNPGTAVVVAVVYGLIDFLLFGVLAGLTAPLVALSFGLFIFVINAFLLWLTDRLLDDFKIRDLPTTFVAALLISVFKWILNAVF